MGESALLTTICLNPALDRTVTVDAFRPGAVNRIRDSRTDVGGKGVNVALVCRRLGLAVQVLGCAGASGADTVRAALEAEGAAHAFLTVDGAVRVNTKIVSLDGFAVTELNEPGAALTGQDRADFFALAAERTRGSDFAVITGSLPPGCPPDTYRRLIETLSPVRCILDVSGAALREGVKARPFLIKPNQQELAETLGREVHTLEDVCEAARSFVEAGVRHVVVSMGGDGAFYLGEAGCFHAPAIPVTVHSTVGAGDAMIGGILHGLMTHGTMREALRAGVAAGTASVMTEGTQLIRPQDFKRLLEQVRIQEL